MQKERGEIRGVRKDVWTGNPLHIQRRNRVSNPGCIGARELLLHNMLLTELNCLKTENMSSTLFLACILFTYYIRNSQGNENSLLWFFYVFYTCVGMCVCGGGWVCVCVCLFLFVCLFVCLLVFFHQGFLSFQH